MIFNVDDNFEEAGIRYRVVAGNRCPGDMILEFCPIKEGWHRPTLSHTFILLCFKAQVEENNYGSTGKVKVGLGMRYLFEAVIRALHTGWRKEAERIRQQRERLERWQSMWDKPFQWPERRR